MSTTLCPVCGEPYVDNTPHNLVGECLATIKAERDRLALDLAKANPVNWDAARWNETLDRLPAAIAQQRGLAHDFKTWSDAQWFVAMGQAPEIVGWMPRGDADWELVGPKKDDFIWVVSDHTSWWVGYDRTKVSSDFGEPTPDGSDDDPVEMEYECGASYPWGDDRGKAFAMALDGVAAIVLDAGLRVLPGPATLRSPEGAHRALHRTWRQMSSNLQADIRFARMRPNALIAVLVERVFEDLARKELRIPAPNPSTSRVTGWSAVLPRWRWTVYPGAPDPTVGWAESAAEAFAETDRVLVARGYTASTGAPTEALNAAVTKRLS